MSINYLGKYYRVYYIGVFCDLNVMQERELRRGDRQIGLANAQFDCVHHGSSSLYDFTVDTTHSSPFEAAQAILNFISNNPAPQSFSKI